MGIKSLRLSELRGLDDKAIADRIADFCSGHDESGSDEIEDLNHRISAFEMRYEMPTAVMLERLRMGIQKETCDMIHWIQLNEIRERLVNRESRRRLG